MSDDTDIIEARARAGKAIRDLGHAFIGHDATLEQIERLSDVVEEMCADLEHGAPRSKGERHEFSATDKGELPQGYFRHTFDDRPVSGRASPWGLDPELHRHGDEIVALVTLRSAHEGAPGRSHGGVVAALFDDVFGSVLDIVQQAAFTGDLYLRYVAPTPLHRQLECRVRMTGRDGRRIFMTGELSDPDNDQVVVTAKATFIAVDSVRFASATAARPAPPDEDA
jgi:acyl-coenzyme A thioesterase PaaI-like protein